ncbi:phosphatase-1 catalytic subunit binding region [Finch poxvirus]|uniref:Phosphatase-1 catalytic subunit binding region n=1 Tax=Condorpox virus TaxID=3049970 RepID=A0AAT9UPZ3_9POXV|nr:phosphatase-1 catalytic subunit binding region [Finch poxvirus]UOX39003.1 phosphatase-1 catalytic subunit binding region [Finch poxvirus]
MEMQERADVKRNMSSKNDKCVDGEKLQDSFQEIALRSEKSQDFIKEVSVEETDSSDEWDESDEDSSCDTAAKNMKLWNMFCRSNDPYNLFKFTAPINKGCYDTTCPIDVVKKSIVTFSETVIEYNVPYEDRKGPWEEIARDRYRFMKRIKETAEIIEFCLSENHRRYILETHLKYENNK